MGVTDREQAAIGAEILQRLVSAPDKGPGWRRDPQTGHVYYSAHWLGDDRRWHLRLVERAT